MAEIIVNYLKDDKFEMTELGKILASLILFSSQDQLSRLSKTDMFTMYKLVLEWKNNTDPIIKENDRAASYELLGFLLKGEVEETEEAWMKLVEWHDNPRNPLLETQEAHLHRGYKLLTQFEDEYVDVLVFIFSIYEKYLSDINSGKVVGKSLLKFDLFDSTDSANGHSFGINVFKKLGSIADRMRSENIDKELDEFLKMFISFANHLKLDLNLVNAMARKLKINHANRNFGSHSLLDKHKKSIPLHEVSRLFGYDNIFSKRLRSLYSQYKKEWIVKVMEKNGPIAYASDFYKVEFLTDEMKAPFAEMFLDKQAFSNHDYQHGRKTTIVDEEGNEKEVSLDGLTILQMIDNRFAELVEEGVINPAMFLQTSL